MAFPSHAHARPNQARVADFERGPVGSPIIHMSAITPWSIMARADPGATLCLPLKSTDLSLFNLADHTGYNEIPLDLNPAF